jgi:CheY-like chemotaxis protein
VIEAADGDGARRVLDSVHVDVVFADLAMPDQTNGLALLRWLRQRHPAIRTILTSGTDTNLAALDGYGIFLSKPYRLVDLGYCLQKALAGASIPANGAGGAITADPSAKTSPEPGKADGGDDEVSKSSMAELTRRLGERAAQQRAVDPVAAKAARRAALQAYDRARARRLRLVLSGAMGAVVGSGIAYLVPTIGSLPAPPPPITTAHTEQASPIEMAAATQVSAPPDSAPSPLPPPASLASARPFPTVGTEPAPATGGQQAPVEPAPNQILLRRDEVREVQARLRSFGFNPGRDDGVPGPTTEGAVMHYQQDRGQPQTGTVDRQLLEQLRQDPAPQVAQRAARPDARATRSPAPQRSDPLGPVRVAGDRFGRWLDSLVR